MNVISQSCEKPIVICLNNIQTDRLLKVFFIHEDQQVGL